MGRRGWKGKGERQGGEKEKEKLKGGKARKEKRISSFHLPHSHLANSGNGQLIQRSVDIFDCVIYGFC